MNCEIELAKMRNNRYRNYEKPAWEVERDRIAREREETIQRNIQPTEENFPALGGIRSAKPIQWNSTRFNELAAQWQVADDEAKAREEQQKRAEVTKPERFVMPHFNPSRHYVEVEETDPIPSAPPSSPSPVTEDEWMTIDRVAKNQARLSRRQARLEERLRRLDEGEIEENEEENPEENDETCWEHDVAPVGKGFHS